MFTSRLLAVATEIIPAVKRLCVGFGIPTDSFGVPTLAGITL